MTVAELIIRVRHLLQDDGVRWTDAELVQWLNDGQRVIVINKPQANAVTSAFSCAAGVLQELPAGGLQLLDVTHNSSGTQRSIRLVPRASLDAESPTWRAATRGTEVRAYCYDDRTPRVFHVWPPVQATTSIEIVYSASPAEVTIESTALSLDDVYIPALIDYVAYRAYSKDAEYAQSGARVALHRDAFATALGLRRLVENTEGPRTAVAREQPTAGAA